MTKGDITLAATRQGQHNRSSFFGVFDVSLCRYKLQKTGQ